MVWLGQLIVVVVLVVVDSRQPPTLPWLLRAPWLFPRAVFLIETLFLASSIHMPEYILTFDIAGGQGRRM